MRSEIVIVGVTKMKNAACVGGIERPSGRSLRLMERGTLSPFPVTTSIRPGDVIEVDLRGAISSEPPHVEDVAIGGWRVIERFNDLELARWLLGLPDLPLWRGSVAELFDATLIEIGEHSAGLIRGGRLPSQSTGFWIPDRPLSRLGKDRFAMRKGGEVDFAIKSIGIQPITQREIPAGALLRVSLARWWRRDGIGPEMCALQLSGLIHPGFGLRKQES
jgi:hypothetical protein